MKVYQVMNHNEWCCPGMLVYVDSDNNIVATQCNPENTMTYNSKGEDEDWGLFNPDDYKEVKEVGV